MSCKGWALWSKREAAVAVLEGNLSWFQVILPADELLVIFEIYDCNLVGFWLPQQTGY